jgi:parallel beta-helix repeat protein
VRRWENEVINNNKSLNLSNQQNPCPGLPAFETLEGFDCGEGIHLSGVDHSVVGNNTAKHNAGGILLSDDTGATYQNLIIGNLAQENPFDCGITIASHPPAKITNSISPLGVFHNTIANNDSSRNGFQVPGAGAGVGIFDSAPGTQAYGNVVINNELKDNGLPGVALHSHTPNQNLNDNVITGNRISGNGADTDDAATPGTDRDQRLRRLPHYRHGHLRERDRRRGCRHSHQHARSGSRTPQRLTRWEDRRG